MAKRIVILGSTGSIGRQALEVIHQFPDDFIVTGLAAGGNWQLLAEQIKEFKPEVVSIKDEQAGEKFISSLGPGKRPEIFFGESGLKEVAAFSRADLVLTAVPGIAGLLPTVAAIQAGKNIALANKETLVTAGELVMSLTKEYGVDILPVDSEHSAIMQCLGKSPREKVAKIILTASGGPFLKKPADLTKVTVQAALAHPNWKMGRKVTIDSATLMNKGLEVIEARWLFGLKYEHIQVIVHPQSIIHSMVEFIDGSILAQLGFPDMRIPIQFALTYPERQSNQFFRINWNGLEKLTFESLDTKRFRCLALAVAAGREGGTMPVVLNAANEVAVESFLAGKITFLAIPEIIEKVMNVHQVRACKSIEDVLATDRWAKSLARRQIQLSIVR